MNRRARISPKKSSTLIVLVVTLAVTTLAACSTDNEPAARGNCPTDPVPVVVTVDQWGDITKQLGGDCATVTTIITGSSADPHDFEPTPGDIAKFGDAKLVVRNGLGYDAWANKALSTLDTQPQVIDGGRVVGSTIGDNPHLWYGPARVRTISFEINRKLKAIAPDNAGYFDAQQVKFETAMQPYEDQIAKLKPIATGTTYAATEPVFDLMADALGMKRVTPDGYQNAALNDGEPGSADVAAFEQRLRGGEVKVLIVNTQTNSPSQDQLRKVAETAGVAILDVTETVPPGVDNFFTWQVAQLQALAKALGA